MKELIKKIIQKTGYRIASFPDYDIKRRMMLIDCCKINKILDVGANDGKYASDIRTFGYNNTIVSFEPLIDAFEKLLENSKKDNNWKVNNFALGNYDGEAIINISKNSVSSSILNVLEKHLEVAPESKFISQQKIEIKKLDTVYSNYCDIKDNVMLKIDTQGFEEQVLEGGKISLDHIKVIQLELSIVPLYENEMLFENMLQYIISKGFQLFSIENGMCSIKTGQLLQADGVFVKRGILN